MPMKIIFKTDNIGGSNEKELHQLGGMNWWEYTGGIY